MTSPKYIFISTQTSALFANTLRSSHAQDFRVAAKHVMIFDELHATTDSTDLPSNLIGAFFFTSHVIAENRLTNWYYYGFWCFMSARKINMNL